MEVNMVHKSGQEKKTELVALWHMVQNSLLQMVVLKCGAPDAECHYITSGSDAGPVNTSVRKSSPMNRKKTGTGPDCNRLQPDLRLPFIRPEKITGCGSSKSGIWVNRHRAGWDHHRQRASIDNDNDHSDTRRADCSNNSLNTSNQAGNRANTNNHDIDHTHVQLNINIASTTTTTTAASTTRRQPRRRSRRRHTGIDSRKDNTSTTVTRRQPQHQQFDNHDDQPQQQHVDNYDDDTSTPATSTRRHPQHQHEDTRNINTKTPATSTRRHPQHQHEDTRNIITSTTTTTTATTTHRQPRSTTTTRDNCDFGCNIDTSTTTGATTTTSR
ncbi:hypothetical protein EDB85DRAFT_1896554 [Lactarius pseudohatsudake]|nr:hypothetical protein EDB85DRAFT_1896554 [Lactarius pseudohatsudake]